RQATRVRADTLEELAGLMEGIDAEGFLRTMAEYNGAVSREVPFDPTVKDGKGTTGINPPKSNWANTLDSPPFEAFSVTCGITFTFGGLRITADEARVLDTEERPIEHLFAAGELVGGLFYNNFPGGSGLTAGAVFGRIAGRSAGKAAKGA